MKPLFELLDSLEPCAQWSNDCQGKKDYDGRLLSISTRYWPATPTVPNEFNPASGKWTAAPYGEKPSATASIAVNHGKPDQYGYGDYTTLCEQKFEADTEGEVKALVEAWVKAECNRILHLIVP